MRSSLRGILFALIVVFVCLPAALLRADTKKIKVTSSFDQALQYGDSAARVDLQYTYGDFDLTQMNVYLFSPTGVLEDNNGNSIPFSLSWTGEGEQLSTLLAYKYLVSQGEVPARVLAGDAHFFLRIEKSEWDKAVSGSTYEGDIRIGALGDIDSTLIHVSVVIPESSQRTSTITLDPGEGSGSVITFKETDSSRFDPVSRPESDYVNGALFQSDEQGIRSYKFDSCPSTFTAPSGKVFAGWKYYDETFLPGTCRKVKGNIRLTAIWRSAAGTELTYAVPSTVDVSVGESVIKIDYSLQCLGTPYIKFYDAKMKTGSDESFALNLSKENNEYAYTESYESDKQGEGSFYLVINPTNVWFEVRHGVTYTGSISYVVRDEYYQIEKTGEIRFSFAVPHYTFKFSSGDKSFSASTSDTSRISAETDVNKCPRGYFCHRDGSAALTYIFPDFPSGWTVPAGKEFLGWRKKGVDTSGYIDPGCQMGVNVPSAYEHNPGPTYEYEPAWGDAFVVSSNIADPITIPYRDVWTKVEASLTGRTEYSNVQTHYMIMDQNGSTLSPSTPAYLYCGEKKIRFYINGEKQNQQGGSTYYNVFSGSDVSFYICVPEWEWQKAESGTYTCRLRYIIYDGDLPYSDYSTETGRSKVFFTTIRLVVPDTLYDVSFDANGGTITIPDPGNYASGMTYKLPGRNMIPSYVAAPDGYEFGCWTVISGGNETDYKPSVDITITGKTVIKATWYKATYKIVYSLDGGTNHKDNPTQYTIDSDTIILKTPSKNNYVFKGWYDTNKKVYVSEIPHGSFGSMSLKAIWEIASGVTTHTVSFLAGEGTGSMTSEVFPEGSSYNLPASGFTAPTGYTFDKWEVTIGTDDAVLLKSGSPITVSADVSMKATYQPVQYRIVYSNLGTDGINHEDNPTTYTINDEVSLKDPTRAGYTFQGWYTNSQFSGDPVTKIAKGSTGVKTFYAKWAETYTITWKNDNGSILGTTTVVKGETPSWGSTPTKASTASTVYTFKGWTPSVVAATADATYTATYKSFARTYTIMFMNEDGTLLQKSSVAYGSMPSYIGATPKKAATAKSTFEFSGWSPKIAKVTGQATYTAVFTEHAIATPTPTETPTPTVTKTPPTPTVTKTPPTPTVTKVPPTPTVTKVPPTPTVTKVPPTPTVTKVPPTPTVTTVPPTPTITKAPPTPTTAPETPTPTPEKEPSIADFVERLYTVALNRASEPEGKAYWVKEIESGNRTGGDCAHFFLIEAEEFRNRGLNEEDFVETLYLTFFDRASEPDGKAYWVGELKKGTLTRNEVISGFIDSREWCNVCATYGVKSGAPTAKAEIASKNATKFATRLYTCCLGRDPEEGGLKYWSLALTNLEQTGCSAAKNFFTSDEFVNFKLKDDEYVRRLYTTFMGRDPEASEIAYWTGEISKGTQTRETIMAFFGQSEEFTNICKTYGIERGTI